MQAIETQEPWSFKIKVNDGGVRNEVVINSKQLNDLKHDSNERDGYEWARIIHNAFFEDAREEYQNVKISASLRDTVVLDIVLNIGNGIMTQLGSIQLKEAPEAEDEEEDEYNLFDWTKEALSEKATLKLESRKYKSEIDSLRSQLEESLRAQEELVSEVEQKESYQLKVFTKILNSFQDYNRRLISGEIIETEDQFNQDHIKAAIADVQAGHDASAPPALKKRRTRQEVKKEPKKRGRPKKVVSPEPEEKAEEKDDDPVNSKENTTNLKQEINVKEESNPSTTQSQTQPQLAGLEQSVKFQFRNPSVKQEYDQDQEQEIPQSDDKTDDEQAENNSEENETQDETEDDNATETEDEDDNDTNEEDDHDDDDVDD